MATLTTELKEFIEKLIEVRTQIRIEDDLEELLEQHTVEGLNAVDEEAEFDAMFDEQYSFDKLGEPFEHLSPSKVYKEMDEIGYAEALNNWADTQDWTLIKDKYYRQEDIRQLEEDLREELCQDVREQVQIELAQMGLEK